MKTETSGEDLALLSVRSYIQRLQRLPDFLEILQRVFSFRKKSWTGKRQNGERKTQLRLY